MAKIKIGERDYRLAFSMGAACNFETMTGKSSLDLKTFLEQSDGNLKPLAQLGYCMLAASNKETDVPEFHDFVGSLDTIAKISEFRAAFEQALAEFFGQDKSVDPSKQEDASKNA